MIKCKICGKKCRFVNYSHLKTHNVTVEKYKEMFPDVDLCSDEVKMKMASNMRGNIKALGYKHTDATKKRISKSLKGNKHNVGRKLPESHKLAIRNSLNTPECKKLRSEVMKAVWRDPIKRQKMVEARRGVLARTNGRLTEGHRQKIAETVRQRSKDPAYRARLSEGKKKLWQRPEYRKNCVTAVMKAVTIKPNKPEQQLASLLGLLWKYTGDGTLIIDGKCPDFWNGDHRLVELFGDYWHRGKNPQGRIDFFARHGYKCLVIWEHELTDKEKVKKRIRSFLLD